MREYVPRRAKQVMVGKQDTEGCMMAYREFDNGVCRVVVMLVFLIGLASNVAHGFGDESDREISDAERRQTAVALNYSRASLHRIRRYPCARVLYEEREKILNHLNLNGIADEEVLQLYSSVLDEIAQIQIGDAERFALRERYKHAVGRELFTTALAFAAEFGTMQWVSAVRSGASSWWDFRNIANTRDSDLWQVDKDRLNTIHAKSIKFLDVSWKMARNKKIPDRWLVRSDDLDRLEQACNENDPNVRLRVFKRMEPFLECYPPYWYYLARTQQSLGQLFAASETYGKLVDVGSGHFRKDEMLAAGLANRAYIQAYLHQPSARQTAQAALEQATDGWEANLVCAEVLMQTDAYQDAEDAILRNLDAGLERANSQIWLLGLYVKSRNIPALRAALSKPELVREIPVPALISALAALEGEIPANVVSQLGLSLQAAPRFNLGRDDIVVTAGLGWQLREAKVSLQFGDKTFNNARSSVMKDSILVSFDNIGELGGPLISSFEDQRLVLNIQYPNLSPLEVTLSTRGAGTANNSTLEKVVPVLTSNRRYPVFRLTNISQGELKLSMGPVATLIHGKAASGNTGISVRPAEMTGAITSDAVAKSAEPAKKNGDQPPIGQKEPPLPKVATEPNPMKASD